MASDTRTDPRQTGGLTSYFVAEGDAGTESTMGWDQVRLTAKDLMTLSRMTNQVNADAIINFGDTLAYECAYSSALKEDQCLLIGDDQHLRRDSPASLRSW
jgi:HK97 family phage major capsid protein